jgi:hypothetical protein
MLSKIAMRLIENAVKNGSLLSVYRAIGDEAIVGVPLKAGSDWLALARAGDGGQYEGIDVIRTCDVVRISAGGRELDALGAIILGAWPTRSPAIDLSDPVAVVTSLAAAAGYVTVHLEGDLPGTCFIGEIVEIDAQACELRAYGTMRSMSRSTEVLSTPGITRAQVFGSYEAALVRAYSMM